MKEGYPVMRAFAKGEPRLARPLLAMAVAVAVLATVAVADGEWTVVDLNPSGSSYSIATASCGGVHAGFAYLGSVPHAGLWAGSGGSWLDLTPAGATQSGALGVYGG